MTESKFTKKSQKKLTPAKPKNMEELLADQEQQNEPEEKMPDARKTVHLTYELNEKLRLLVFQKRFPTERAAIEAGLKLLFKKEKV